MTDDIGPSYCVGDRVKMADADDPRNVPSERRPGQGPGRPLQRMVRPPSPRLDEIVASVCESRS